MSMTDINDGEGSLDGFKYDGHLIEDEVRYGQDDTAREYVKVTRPDGFEFFLRTAYLDAQLEIAMKGELIPQHVADVIAKAYEVQIP